MKTLLWLVSVIMALTVAPSFAQSASDPWRELAFLEGTWEAKTAGNGPVTASGTYTFTMELRNHILARHSTNDAGCKAPTDFNCEHSDLLYVYQDAPGERLKAIYFDNEGHVIHYNVSAPEATTAQFLSDSSESGPQFRLIYELKGSTMSGKFEMRMPGNADWKSYLEWSGKKLK